MSDQPPHRDRHLGAGLVILASLIYASYGVWFGVVLGIALFSEHIVFSVVIGVLLIMGAAAIPYLLKPKTPALHS